MLVAAVEPMPAPALQVLAALAAVEAQTQRQSVQRVE
jgi:hypothetical protein